MSDSNRPSNSTTPASDQTPGRLAVALNASANYLRWLVALGVMFVLTPHVIHSLGNEQYGLWMLVASLVGYFELLDCGLATSTVKFVGQFRGSGDVHRRNQLVSTLLLTYLVIAAVVLLIAAVLGSWLTRALSVSDFYEQAALWTFALLAGKVAVNLPLSLFLGVLFGSQRICLVSGIRTVAALTYGITAWHVLSNGGGLLEFAMVNASVSIAEHVVLLAACLWTTPQLRIRWQLVDSRLFRQVAGFSVFSLMTNLSAAAPLRTDPILVKMFRPLTDVAVYALALKIAEQLLLLTKQGLNAFTPLIAQLHGAGHQERIRGVLFASSRFSLGAMLVLATPLACWGSETLQLWVGPGFEDAAAILALLAASMAVRVVQESASNLLAMTGRHRYVALMSLINAGLNVLLSLLLIQLLQLPGVALATLLSTLATTFWVARRACLENELRPAELWSRSISPVLQAGAIQLAVCLLLRRLCEPSDWASLLAVLAAGAGVMVLAFWALALSDDERQLLTRQLRRRRARPPAGRAIVAATGPTDAGERHES